MSSSLRESIRFQSVLERFFVFFPLGMIGLSQRDDANGVVQRLSERYKGAAAFSHSNPDPSLFAIVLPHIGTNEKKAAEHLLRVGEMEPVFADVDPVLGL